MESKWQNSLGKSHINVIPTIQVYLLLTALNESLFKDLSTPAIKLYNWNLVSEAMMRVGIPLDNDIKGLIVNGDTEMLVEALKDIYQAENVRME